MVREDWYLRQGSELRGKRAFGPLAIRECPAPTLADLESDAESDNSRKAVSDTLKQNKESRQMARTRSGIDF